MMTLFHPPMVSQWIQELIEQSVCGAAKVATQLRTSVNLRIEGLAMCSLRGMGGAETENRKQIGVYSEKLHF